MYVFVLSCVYIYKYTYIRDSRYLGINPYIYQSVSQFLELKFLWSTTAVRAPRMGQPPPPRRPLKPCPTEQPLASRLDSQAQRGHQRDLRRVCMIPRDQNLIFARPRVYIRKKINVLTKPLFVSPCMLSLVIMRRGPTR